MDASTSTAGDANNNYHYDVFVNHRGPDVKKTFASHLYRRLIPHGLRVLLDYEELQVGEKLTPQIEKAIETASVHVAIFSPGYARSSWCLNELLHMLKSGAPIVPVFRHVEPADLRWTQAQGRGYAQALCDLEKKTTKDGQQRYSSTIIEEWRNALLSVADRSGLELKAFNEDEGLLLDKVIECVLRKVKKTQLNVAKHPTGLDEKAQHFEEIVLSKQHSGRVRVVGIAGMGGVGKTTLAKELFNRKSSNDRNSCFLFDVRENAKRSLPSLQRKLLKGLFQSDRPIDNTAQGIEMLREHLKEKPVLIVLDDVDNVDQVDNLLPMDVLQPDSLILITSRDKDVLLKSGVQETAIYQLTGLDEYHSRELFCSYAFCKPSPPPSEFEYLIHQFLKACNGLPLSLKVLGALVYGKAHRFWKIQLRKLRKTLHQDIKKSLQISYDALDEDQKQIFLDIACFFIGEEKDMAIKIWDGSGWFGWVEFQPFQDKCLVEVDFENRISMHDHLRDLGRHLAKYPTLPCRLWRGKEDIDDLKQHSDGKANVRGISFRRSYEEAHPTDRRFPIWRQNRRTSIPGRQDEEYDSEEEEDGDEHDDADSLFQLTEAVKVAKLQLLDVDFLSKDFMCRVDKPKLVWLRWCACDLSALPPWIPVENLRVLEVHGQELKTLWDDKSKKVPLQLRELRIFAPLSKIPESIRKLRHLEHISLSACTDLERIPNSFGDLRKLRTVQVHACYKLKELPGFGNLRSLEELSVSACWKLKSIQGSAELKKLRTLKVSDCPELEELPDFENLSSLEELRVSECYKLKGISVSTELPKLRTLNVVHCSELEELPSFENLSSLEVLCVNGCAKLKSIPGLAHLTELRLISCIECHELEELPDVEHLRSLTILITTGCPKLQLDGGVVEQLRDRLW